MTESNPYHEDQHATSQRIAVFEDDGVSAWLYLSERETRTPVADVWVYNRIPAPPPSEIPSYRGGPPPAPTGFAGEGADCRHPNRHVWSLHWSPDGEAVAITKDREAIAYLLPHQKLGYSRQLLKDGPWGHVWLDQLFATVFPNIDSQ